MPEKSYQTLPNQIRFLTAHVHQGHHCRHVAVLNQGVVLSFTIRKLHKFEEEHLEVFPMTRQDLKKKEIEFRSNLLEIFLILPMAEARLRGVQ